MNLKGCRTVVFGFAVIVLGQFGQHVPPEILKGWLGAAFAAIGVGIVWLRMVTTTPVFARLATDVGFTPDEIAGLKSALAALPDSQSGIGDALTALAAKIEALTPPSNPAPTPAAPAAGPSLGGPSALAGVAALFLAGSLLTGCASIQAVTSELIPPAPKTAQQTVALIKAGLVTAEDSVLAFDAQICPVAATCRDGRVIALSKAMIADAAAIQLAENAVRENADGTPLAVQAVSDAQGALNLFQTVMAQYGVQIAPTPAPATNPAAPAT